MLKGFSESGLPCSESTRCCPWPGFHLAASDPSAPHPPCSVTAHRFLRFSATSVCCCKLDLLYMFKAKFSFSTLLQRFNPHLAYSVAAQCGASRFRVVGWANPYFLNWPCHCSQKVTVSYQRLKDSSYLVLFVLLLYMSPFNGEN